MNEKQIDILQSLNNLERSKNYFEKMNERFKEQSFLQQCQTLVLMKNEIESFCNNFNEHKTIILKMLKGE